MACQHCCEMMRRAGGRPGHRGHLGRLVRRPGLHPGAEPDQHFPAARCAWCLAGGALVTVLALRGFAVMSRAAFVTVPGFLCLADGTAGQHLTCLTGMPPAHAAYTARIVPVVVRASAVAGAITIVTAVVTVNTWNLYSASLATADAADRHASRPAVTVVIGAAGPLLSAIGIIGRFVPFLTVLGAAVPRLRAS